ncbi:MAG: hypothetical protein NT175_02065 [Bacteroidetes bacterium]|nr:hypothetical protein [Bacteroidota bacterium]
MAQRRRKPVTRARRKPARSAGRRSGRKKSRKNEIRLFFTVLVLSLIAIWIWKPKFYVSSSDFIRQTYNNLTDKRDSRGVPVVPPVVMRTHNNYAADIDKLAAQFNLSPEYLKSPIILECSGQKDVKPRYEKHIYRYLSNVREKKLNKFENITYSHLQDATDEALKNMARSWGPFQIMGYKCILLDI